MAVYPLVSIIVSFILGFSLAVILYYKKPIGTMRIDRSEPNDEPYLFLELNNGVAQFKDNTTVCFRVSTKNYISHE